MGITRWMHTNGRSPHLSGPFACSFFPSLFSPSLTLCTCLALLHHLLAYLHPFYLSRHQHTHTHTYTHTHTPPSPVSHSSSFFLPADNLKGRQLLHTTYKMFMTAAGVEGESFYPEQTHTQNYISIVITHTHTHTHSR